MPRRTNAFQRLVLLLTATLAGHARVTESAMLRDKVTGELREVDVLVEVTAASYPVTLGLEVVAWARVADVQWVERMHCKHTHLPTDKLVLVSENGFSKQAIRKAEFLGIETLTMDEAFSTDWALAAELEESGFFELTTMHFDLSAKCLLLSGEMTELPMPLGATFQWGHEVITMERFVRGVLDREDIRDTIRQNIRDSSEHRFTLIYSKPGGLWNFDNEGVAGQVQELLISLKVLKSESPVRFAVGKFRSVPFVSGSSVDPESVLQFVLAKTPEGLERGYLIDESGIRTLGPSNPLQ